MVTYLSYQKKPGVRFLLPPPFFIFLAILLLSGSSMAADQQSEYSDINYYAAAPDTLAVAAASPESLSRVVGGDVFGIYWSSFGGNGKITSADGYDMTGRADGVQDLATATYSTFKAVEAAINSSGSSLEGILTNILRQLEKDDNPNFDNLYTRLLALYDQQTELASDNRTFWNDFWQQYTNRSIPFVRVTGSTDFGFSIPDLLAGLSSHLGYMSVVRRSPWLNSDGSNGSGDISFSGALGRGLVGLATLLSGSDAHRGEWVWLNQGGYEGNGTTSLMDMVGEGFLGLSALLTTAEPGETRLSWMYVSPDDGLTGTQLKHDTLFSFLGSFASGVQNPLARLSYVLADLDDISLKQQEKPNVDAVKDSFFGDGEGAVNPDQIKEIAGIGTSFKSAFTSPVSIVQFFSTLSDGGNYVFFSQETADNLDRVGQASVAALDDSDPFEGFVLGEDGLYYPESSLFDLYSYLEGLS